MFQSLSRKHLLIKFIPFPTSNDSLANSISKIPFLRPTKWGIWCWQILYLSCHIWSSVTFKSSSMKNSPLELQNFGEDENKVPKIVQLYNISYHGNAVAENDSSTSCAWRKSPSCTCKSNAEKNSPPLSLGLIPLPSNVSWKRNDVLLPPSLLPLAHYFTKTSNHNHNLIFLVGRVIYHSNPEKHWYSYSISNFNVTSKLPI